VQIHFASVAVYSCSLVRCSFLFFGIDCSQHVQASKRFSKETFELFALMILVFVARSPITEISHNRGWPKWRKVPWSA